MGTPEVWIPPRSTDNGLGWARMTGNDREIEISPLPRWDFNMDWVTVPALAWAGIRQPLSLG